MTTTLDRLWPAPQNALDDEAVLATYAFPDGCWLRMNFVSSLDGAVTREGRSGGLGGPADRRVFALLRRPADVVLVGAGTLRNEGYGGLRMDEDSVVWRRRNGLPPHPRLATLSRHLDLDPGSELFADAPVRPIVYTTEDSPTAARARLGDVADVVVAGTSEVDPLRVREDLDGRGLRRIHAEGGPHAFGSFLAAGAVDELCLTVAPLLISGSAGRISEHGADTPTDMRLASVLRGGDELLLRHVRA